MRERTEACIAEYLRPLVEADGGVIELVEAANGRVIIGLGSACMGCPGRPFTVADVIEPALRRALGPDVVVEVRALLPTNGHKR